VSFRQSAGQMARRARRYDRAFLDESKVTSDPTLRAVFLEDAVSVSGDVIAFAALALNQITGSSIPQGVAAVVIALVLIRVSLRLIRRSHDFLVGAWAAEGTTSPPSVRRVTRLTPALRPADEERVRAFLSGYTGVIAVRELLFTFVGPGRLWLVARVAIDDGLRGTQVQALVRGIESALKDEAQEFYRVDVVPIGGGPAH
jgi:divalent metal cation (Fe/Co/Zn/Cd) transporter